MSSSRTLPLLAAVLFVIPLTSGAGTATDTFSVTLEITAACTLTASDLDFGTQGSSITLNVDASTTLTVNCTLLAPYSVGLDNGTGAGATAAARKLTNAGDSSTVDYSLYTDVTRLNVWDNNCTTLPGVAVTCGNGVGTGLDQSITVYGRVPSGQSGLSAGTYSDTITATITF